MNDIDLNVRIGKLVLRNPILLASGTAGYGNEIAALTDLNAIGGIVTKSLSLKPRKGNPPQRIVETAAGMLNAIGLANVGIEEFIEKKIPFLRELNSSIICNIAASTIDEYAECTRVLNDQDVIRAFEINVSCPNVREGGLEFGHDLKALAEITRKVRKLTDKTLIIKLSPNVSRIWEFAKAVQDEGADAVSAINTLVGCSFDIYKRKPKLHNVTGGLSGPAIKPVAIAKVLEIKRNTTIPIIGIGGIMNWADAVEFMIAGASAVQIGTVNFINPDAGREMIEGLKSYCEKISLKRISELTGSYII